MLSAVTDANPSAARINTIAPKPVNTLSPTWLISGMPVPLNLSPAQPASSAPTTINQPPPSAEPQ